MQKVIDKKGTVKVNQYGQWDGYPSEQGVDILRFLKNANLEKYQENLSKLKRYTKKMSEEVDKTNNWPEVFPWLTRDCGALIHGMIADGLVSYVKKEGKQAESWCEGFYVIDFNKGIFSAEFRGVRHEFPLDKLPSERDFLMLFDEFNLD